jgi:hypothetical protein
MKTQRLFIAGLALAALSTLNLKFSTVHAATTTIDSVNRYAYGANVGWMNWTGDTANGVVIGEYVCSGYIYSANVGWINLGSGSPANGIQYQNNSATDFGVNQDGLGNLRGYAYGANTGWINFETTGAPRINMITGQMSGYVWSANCGWISLSNAVAYVKTDVIQKGALAPDGLPIAWLLTYFGTTNVNANADPTGKGMTIAQDYLAGTDPNNINSVFRITAESFSSGGTSATLTWNSVPTRYYTIQKTPGLSSPDWVDSGLGLVSPSAGSTTTAGFTETTAPMQFYRVEAVRPLISVLQTPGLPNLTITFVGPNSVVVSWPNTGSYTLQQNSNLTTPVGWTTSGYSMTTANGTNSITITPPTGNLFFRLANP